MSASDRTLQEQQVALDRIRDEIESGRLDEIGDFLLEYIAEWGPAELAQLARRVFERQEEDE